MSDMVKFLESRGVLIRYAKGGWQSCRCPFHDDSHASARLNSVDGKFHCFVCGLHEDVVGLIRHENPGVGYVEAKQQASDLYGQGVDQVGRGSGAGCTLLDFSWDKPKRGGTLPSWRGLLR